MKPVLSDVVPGDPGRRDKHGMDAHAETWIYRITLAVLLAAWIAFTALGTFLLAFVVRGGVKASTAEQVLVGAYLVSWLTCISAFVWGFWQGHSLNRSIALLRLWRAPIPPDPQAQVVRRWLRVSAFAFAGCWTVMALLLMVGLAS